MASYELARDRATGAVIFRLLAPVPDMDAERLSQDMPAMIGSARETRGKVRVLIDNRQGVEFASPAMAAFAAALRSTYRAGDRVAVVVPSSLGKIRAKQQLDATTQCFLSDSAAMTWLSAWDTAVAGDDASVAPPPPARATG